MRGGQNKIPLNEVIGLAFGRWTVISAARKPSPQTRVHCRCACGTEKDVILGNLRHGTTTSCGCVNTARVATLKYRHGGCRTREYNSWANAKRRCNDQSNSAYAHYGGRGIRMAAEWVNDFAAFIAHMGPCPKGRTLDRKDNSRGYEPGNCRWATYREQAANTRRNRPITHQGRTMNVSEWAREIGCSQQTLWKRLKKNGWKMT